MVKYKKRENKGRKREIHMKNKRLCGVLIGLVAVAMVGCGEKQATQTSTTETENQAVETQAESAEEATTESDTVVNDSSVEETTLKDSADENSDTLSPNQDGDIESYDLDLSSDTTEESQDNTESASSQNQDETSGEAVLTSATTNVGFIAEAKLSREQVRAKNKEALLEIINNTSISDNQKQAAIDAMIKMTDIAEREAAAETLLESKGFEDVVVSITDDTADVVVNMSEITDAKRAQIEDVMKRKTGVSAENIVITPISVEPQ